MNSVQIVFVEVVCFVQVQTYAFLHILNLHVKCLPHAPLVFVLQSLTAQHVQHKMISVSGAQQPTHANQLLEVVVH